MIYLVLLLISLNTYASGTSTYINQGLLTLCNRDQVAWVLGHELAHYIHQDRDSNYANEYAADKLGSQLMKKAGYNLNRGKLFLLLLPNTYSVDHPKSVDRYRRI